MMLKLTADECETYEFNDLRHLDLREDTAGFVLAKA